MVVNDYAYGLVHRGALESIASKLAPTMDRVNVENELHFKSKKVGCSLETRHTLLLQPFLACRTRISSWPARGV